MCARGEDVKPRARADETGLHRIAAAVLALGLSETAFAQDEGAVADQSILVTAPGAGMDIDDALGLSRADLMRGGQPDLIGALTRQLPQLTPPPAA